MLNHKITRLQNIFFIHPNIYSYSSHFRPSFSKKSPFIFHVGINLLSCEICHFVTCHFHFDFNVRKKRKVREGVSKAKKHLQYKSKLATLVKYT